MNRPPPVPLRGSSPRRRDGGASPSPRRRGGASPSPARAARSTSSSGAIGRPPPPPPPAPGDGSPRIRNIFPSRGTSAPTPTVHGLPTADIASLLRQWGASAEDVEDSDFAAVGSIRGGWLSSGGSSGFDADSGIDSLRLDRSASFDDPPRPGGADDGDAVPGTQHRRIASTGGNREELDLISAELLEGEGAEDADPSDAPAVHSSALHDAARITDWPSVLALSQSHPESARYVGPDGWNALHHACDRRCPHVEVIDSLLSAHPEALVQTNDKGWTPLHRACRNKTPRDVVRLLLRKHPELGKRAAAMRCGDGRSALHYALLYDAPEGVAELLLQADPSAVLDEDRDGISPLGTVWDKYANSFEGRRMLQILLRPFEGEGWELGGGGEAGADAMERDFARRSDKEAAERRVREAMRKDSQACRLLRAKWLRANTLLRAYFRFPLQEERGEGGESERGSPVKQSRPASRPRKWRILHATSAIKCHPSLFLLARALHPEEALEVDENDLFGGGRDSSPDPQSPGTERRASCRTAVHFAAASPLSGREGRNVLKVLLKLNPMAAARVDGRGSLPLHLICRNDRRLHWSNDGVRDVHNAFTAATSCRDGRGKTPLHCAASSTRHCTATAARPSLASLRQPTEGSVIENLVAADPSAAALADGTGRLPLHYFVEHGEEWNRELQSLLNAHPAAARARAIGPSTSGRLPLHMAAASPDARPSLIRTLVQAHPRAASVPDGTGRLPLHLAVDSGRTRWDGGFESIYRAFAPAISAPEDGPRRWMVLHAAAASHSAGRELIEHVLSLNVAAAQAADGEGRRPLHLACAANRSWEDGGVRAIFEADPHAALAEDVRGLLPFHVAAMRSCARSSSPMSIMSDVDVEDCSTGSVVREDADSEDLDNLEVLFNLLIAQPNIIQA